MSDTIVFEGQDPAEINANAERGWREFLTHYQTWLTLDREPIQPYGKPEEACEVSDIFFGATGAGAHFTHPVRTSLDRKKRAWIEEAARHGYDVEVIDHPNYKGRFAFKVKP